MDLRNNQEGEPLLEEARAAMIKERFLDMVSVMARLRRECPWDRKQTAQSMKRYVLEEAYEVVAAIEGEDWSALSEELGDHLLQVLFLARIAEDEHHFHIGDVLSGLIEKMVRRHPHVFGEQEADAEQVAINWEALKRREKQTGEGLFAGFSHGQPALVESAKISRKAAQVGFDWPDPQQVLDKIEEEIGEVREATGTNREHLAEELGDLLFAVSNLVRKFELEPETCLRRANAKFVRRFTEMEQQAKDDGRVFAELDLETQESYWQRAKQSLKADGAQ